MGIKRQFNREFKLSILNELETKKLAEVCREHNLAPSTVSGWRKDYEANPKEAFKGHGKIWKEDAKIAKYERVIGQQYMEIAFLKKACEKLKQLQAEEKRKGGSLLR
jgi:transposase-like protein